MTWRLRPDVYLAQVHGDLVFLDAHANRYFCLPRSSAAPILSALGKGIPPEGDDAWLAELEDAGLVERRDGSTASPPPALPLNATADFHAYAPPDLPITGATLWRLFASALEMALNLALRQPARWLAVRPGDSNVAVTRACALALQFDQLWPWVPGCGRCLPNSMLMRAFLRRHGIAADWVFGVDTYPFEAHCWIEYRGVVLNDTIEHVRWYTPIAAA